MGKSKVCKLQNKSKDGKARKGRRVRAVPKPQQPSLLSCPFQPCRSLHPRWAAMLLDHTRFHSSKISRISLSFLGCGFQTIQQWVHWECVKWNSLGWTIFHPPNFGVNFHGWMGRKFQYSYSKSKGINLNCIKCIIPYPSDINLIQNTSMPSTLVSY